MADDSAGPAANRGTESGSRPAFLDRIRSQAGPSPPGPHPPPPAPTTVPEVRYRALEGMEDRQGSPLAAQFRLAASAVGATVLGGTDLTQDVATVVERHAVEVALLSGEASVEPVRSALRAAGVDVGDAGVIDAVSAQLGVTGARAGIAATGSIVVDSADAARAASLVPPVHLCVLATADIVATPSRVLRAGPSPGSNRVIITGPSRTGDIEQILTVGVHGPIALYIALV